MAQDCLTFGLAAEKYSVCPLPPPPTPPPHTHLATNKAGETFTFNMTWRPTAKLLARCERWRDEDSGALDIPMKVTVPDQVRAGNAPNNHDIRHGNSCITST